MEATVHDSERYRSNAADCLSEVHDAGQPDNRNLNLFTAAAWLSLAREDEAIEIVIASWNTPKVPEARPAFVFQGVLGCFGQPFLAHASSISTESITSKLVRSHHQQPSRA
jgi:hypothetical protein